MDIKVVFVIAADLFITENSGDGEFDHECIHDKIAVSGV